MIDQRKKLIAEYPELFGGIGIECGPGWTEIIRIVCEDFKWYLDNGEVAKIYFEQIKEKFGYLRIYFSWVPAIKNLADDKEKINLLFETLHNITHMAERFSGIVCEDCGRIKTPSLNVRTEAKPSKGGWILTLCDDCRKKRE